MKTLNLYITKAFFSSFLTAIGILTFGMTGARLLKVFEYLANGMPLGQTLAIILYILPTVLTFTIPWAALVAVMLVFGRFSADNEITAMRSSGVSILQIVSPIIVIAFLLTCLCLYLQLFMAPPLLGKARTMLKDVVGNQPTSIFEPGVPVRFNDLRIYVGGKDGEKIREVQVYRMGKDGTWEQDVTAENGVVKTDTDQQVMRVILHNATITTNEGKNTSTSFSDQLVFTIDYGKTAKAQALAQRGKYLRLMEILARMSLDKRRGADTTKLEVELNSRIAFALAPIAFLLLGMPLAIRTSRRETSVGLFLSVLLAGIYFAGLQISDALQNSPKLYPQYLVWLMPVAYQIAGAVFIFKIARK